eukprot:360831-Chlamydomonas_euryale.AAC.3
MWRCACVPPFQDVDEVKEEEDLAGNVVLVHHNCRAANVARQWTNINAGRRWPIVEFSVPSCMRARGGGGGGEATARFGNSDQRTAEVIASRTQVPLAQARALTIHKGQRVAAEDAVVGLGNVLAKGWHRMTTYGQARTVASRVARFRQLRLDNPEDIQGGWRRDRLPRLRRGSTFCVLITLQC